MTGYFPEGYRFDNFKGKATVFTPVLLAEAAAKGSVLEAVAVMCDTAHNLIVDLGCMKGVIPREEGAVGIAEGVVRDIAILSRVGKTVCFTVEALRTDEKGEMYALLSRRRAQELFKKAFLEKAVVGDIFPARVTHLETFGAFLDIGCGIIALLPIDTISVSRISHPADRLRVGQDIKVILKSISDDGKITVSLKELLGTWQENADLFCVRQTVSGVIRSIESYGIFVELTPNLAGLAEPFENARVGQSASVYIKSIISEKMKIKLIIIDSFDSSFNPELKYFYEGKHIDSFSYSPENCEKEISTSFDLIIDKK